eukprot:330044-Hanusia_phi.AAC.2
MSVSFQLSSQDTPVPPSPGNTVIGTVHTLFPVEDSTFFSSSAPDVGNALQCHPDLGCWSLPFGSICLSSFCIFPLVDAGAARESEGEEVYASIALPSHAKFDSLPCYAPTFSRRQSLSYLRDRKQHPFLSLPKLATPLAQQRLRCHWYTSPLQAAHLDQIFSALGREGSVEGTRHVFGCVRLTYKVYSSALANAREKCVVMESDNPRTQRPEQSGRVEERDPQVVTAATFAWARSCLLRRVLEASQRAEGEARPGTDASLSPSELSDWRDVVVGKLVRAARGHGRADGGQANIRKLRSEWDFMRMAREEQQGEEGNPQPSMTSVRAKLSTIIETYLEIRSVPDFSLLALESSLKKLR